MRIAGLLTLMLASAVRLCGQAGDRLGTKGGLALPLGVDAAGTFYLGTADGHIFASKNRGANRGLRGWLGVRANPVIVSRAADPAVLGKL